MDIKNLTTGVLPSRSNDQPKAPAKEIDERVNTATPNSTDKVTLTDFLSQARELETKSQDVNVDNSEKIAALKAAINDGSYQVDSQKVAEKLIQTEALFAKA
ncbi:flagellar biosynthesis anti-sigma factor FlgM [Thiomicrorhabdus sp. Milos-T2]|uniref:flagellar biosynthesis anti-sigma factor FlgM n=1 Tax=Thiomicrorhabdus sp. Milos-T2 TaxID=90814 RepID=UPI0004943CF6|nr:flagellar biosynthesis anti-sigma factor FlgM [Thiomicrorhabdus sp. Milos-T2]